MSFCVPKMWVKLGTGKGAVTVGEDLCEVGIRCRALRPAIFVEGVKHTSLYYKWACLFLGGTPFWLDCTGETQGKPQLGGGPRKT